MKIAYNPETQKGITNLIVIPFIKWYTNKKNTFSKVFFL
jgi:hypothetical protein